MKINIKISVLAVLMVSLSGTTFAQNNKYNEEITIIAPYDPIIPDAFKLNQNPSSVDTSTTKPRMNYQINVNPLTFKPELATLAPTKLANEPQEKLQRNYIKAGAGNYSSFYGELFAGSLRSKKHLVAFNLKHRSTLGKIDEYLDPSNDKTQGTFLAEKYLNKTVLSADVDAFRRVLHYYGMNTSLLDIALPDKDDYKQRFFGAGGSLGIRSAIAGNQKVNYQVKAGYHYLEDINKNLEHNVNVDLNMNKGFRWFRKADYQLYSVGANVNYVGTKDDFGSYNSLIYKINPTAEVHFGEYSLKAGLNLNITDDSITKPYLSPQLEAAVQFADKAVRVFIGMDGGVKQNTLAELIKINEYMGSNVIQSYTYEKFKIYGGFKTNISQNFNLNASISHSSFENIPFFFAIGSPSHGPTYGLVYDDGTLLKISAAFNWLKSEKLTMVLSGEYNKYDLDELEHPYFMPEYTANLGARYAINAKLTCKLNATYHSNSWSNYLGSTLPAEPYYVKIKGWFDESIGAEYKFNKSLSFWLDLNNVAAQRYIIWSDYVSYKFNFLAGASYAF